ncbi:MAG: Endonuclease/exonuclease/phosphatase-like protein [Bacteroidetes bacterium]|nr:MAG: Endonuclease/exonuclease/phosphatase-like protein [Bacteroidota bacterium]
MKVNQFSISLLVFVLFLQPLKAQQIIGYSGLFTFNTKYRITGTITNANTGLPIQGAQVTTINYTSLPSTSTGYYNLFVPYGYGYQINIVAAGYVTKQVTNVNVSISNPVTILNISLLPSSGTCGITTINPNPNPALSKVQQGGVFHRYYKIFDELTGNPLPLIPVSVTGVGFSLTYYSDSKGIVDISINSSNVSGGQPGNQASFSVVSVNNVSIANPIVFSCVVENQEYGKYWDTYTFGKIGLSFVEVSKRYGSSLSLIGYNPVNSTAESFEIKRQKEDDAGFEFSVGVAAGVQCGNAIAGGEAKTGFGGNVAVKTEDQYRFNRSQSATDYEAIGRYIVVTDGIFDFMDETLYRVLQKCESVFAGQNNLQLAYQGDKKSFEVGVFGTAEAGIGIGDSQDIGIAVAGKLGPEANIAFERYYNKAANEKERSIEFSGKFAASGNAGLNFGMSPDDLINGELGANVMFWNREYERGIRLAYIHDMTQPWYTIKEIRFTIIKRNVHSRTGWEEELTYFISGADLLDAIRNISSINMVSQLDNLPDGTVMEVTTSVFKEITEAIFNTAYYMQTDAQGEASINYKTERTDIQNQGSFEISIDGQFLASGFKATIGGGSGFEQGSFYTKENGKWIWGKHFKLQENSAMGTFNDSYQIFMQDLTNDLPAWLKAAIGFVDYITFWNKNTTTHYIGDGGSYIEIDENAIPEGLDSINCLSWSWYGDSPARTRSMLPLNQKSVNDIFRSRAQKSFAMEYGYGGFYQLEPLGAQLNDTCWMTIVYNDADVVDIDESTLGMYREDKENHKWVYIGGIIDTLNNKVTAPFTKLDLFTLAPAAPYGEFSLHANPDSLYSDGISTTIITSDTIFKNNHAPVEDGELYTVVSTSGEITTTDADPILEGKQVLTQNHMIEFILKSDDVSGNAIVSAFSVHGSSKARIEILFYDTLAPAPPVITDVIPGDANAELIWQQSSEPDIAGYTIYYDTDTILPLEGIHTVYGEPSPINVGVSTLRQVNGLLNDSTYYFALSAIDLSGNESELSEFLPVIPIENKKIQITLFFEGLFNQTMNTMNKVSNEYGPIFSDSIADVYKLELRDPLNIDSIVFTSNNRVSVNGISNFEVPGRYTGSYYLVVKHRNSIETWSSMPVSLDADMIYYDLTDEITKAYGNNLKPSGSRYLIFGGDVNQDGFVDTGDMSPVDNDVLLFSTGYLVTDINGDGTVDTADISILDNNSFGFVSKITP